jgi:SAM-dependent methyltransferase
MQRASPYVEIYAWAHDDSAVDVNRFDPGPSDTLPTMTFANTEQAEFWAARASSWMSLESHHARLIGPAGRMAMDRLDPRPGQHIVDLGCGTGLTTLELALRVAPGGRAIGVDIAAALLERARERAAAADIDNIDFEHADVQSSDLGRAHFDGAFSRFGVMFFADPVAAFANIHRSLKPDAVLSLACWQPLTSNQWMFVPAQAAVSVLGTLPEMPDPDAPGPFSLSDEDRVTRILVSAGFHGIDVKAHEDLFHTPSEGISEFADSALRMGAVQRMVEGADPESIQRVRAAIEEAMRAGLRDGEVALTRAIFLVRATA